MTTTLLPLLLPLLADLLSFDESRGSICDRLSILSWATLSGESCYFGEYAAWGCVKSTGATLYFSEMMQFSVIRAWKLETLIIYPRPLPSSIKEFTCIGLSAYCVSSSWILELSKSYPSVRPRISKACVLVTKRPLILRRFSATCLRQIYVNFCEKALLYFFSR